MPKTWPELAVVACSAVLGVGLMGGFAAGPKRSVLAAGRASWILTPGVRNPDVTQATISQTICRHGWTATIRPPSSYTDQLKVEQMEDYARTGSPSDYQEDHLISLELGGHPTDPRNLWPEPIDVAVDVDDVENELN